MCPSRMARGCSRSVKRMSGSSSQHVARDGRGLTEKCVLDVTYQGTSAPGFHQKGEGDGGDVGNDTSGVDPSLRICADTRIPHGPSVQAEGRSIRSLHRRLAKPRS